MYICTCCGVAVMHKYWCVVCGTFLVSGWLTVGPRTEVRLESSILHSSWPLYCQVTSSPRAVLGRRGEGGGEGEQRKEGREGVYRGSGCVSCVIPSRANMRLLGLG